MIEANDRTLHSAINHVHPVGIECECGRRAVVPVERLGATSGSTRLIKELKLRCTGCGSRSFRAFLFFRPQQAQAFAEGRSYAEVWDLRHAGLDENDPIVRYWKDRKNPYREPALEESRRLPELPVPSRQTG